MKIKYGRTFFIILLLAFIGIGGLALYYYFNPKKALTFVIPSINEVSYLNINIVDGDATAKIHLNLKNERPYRMVIDSFICSIRLDSYLLISERIPLHLNLPGYASDSLVVPIHFRIDKIRKSLMELHVKDSTELNAEGYLIYNTFVGKTKLPFTKKLNISVPIPPQIKVLQVKRNKFSLRDKTLAATVKLKIINQGNYINIELKDIFYNLNIKNTLSSKGTITKKIQIKPKSEIEIDLPILVKLEQPFKTYLKIVNDNDSMPYTLNIKANLLEKQNGEDEKIIPVEVNSSGIMELVKEEQK